jgi:hypothetical protein
MVFGYLHRVVRGARSSALRDYLARQSITARIRTILGSQSESGRDVMNELLNAGLGGR